VYVFWGPVRRSFFGGCFPHTYCLSRARNSNPTNARDLEISTYHHALGGACLPFPHISSGVQRASKHQGAARRSESSDHSRRFIAPTFLRLTPFPRALVKRQERYSRIVTSPVPAPLRASTSRAKQSATIRIPTFCTTNASCGGLRIIDSRCGTSLYWDVFLPIWGRAEDLLPVVVVGDTLNGLGIVRNLAVAVFQSSSSKRCAGAPPRGATSPIRTYSGKDTA